ncbi:MAG: alpha/beta family hydrolase [Cyclobacteriaceae bacterium]
MAKLNSKKISISVSESIGKVSGLLVEPVKPKAILVLAHGAGAGMTHSFMSGLADALEALSIATLRYNFPYMEKGKGRPDPPAIAEKTVAAAMEKAHQLFPRLPLFAGGKSFGGRMTSQRVSKECPDYLKGIVFFGFPLHAIGNPSTDRADHLKDVAIPKLFLQGTKDKLAEMELISSVHKKLKHSKLVKFEGADHSFKVGKEIILDVLATSTAEWMAAN